MSTVAAVDCGTNSVRLLVADGGGDRPRELVRRMEIVRLGQDVDRTGELDPAAIERTRLVLLGYAADLERHHVTTMRFVATSATRDVSNRDAFTAMVRATLGVDPEVVTGAEEAALSYRGALDALDPAAPSPVLVADIGGGSTELVLGDRAGPRALRSLDVGCVRLTERHLSGDPPGEAAQAAAVAAVRSALTDAGREVALTSAATLVGLAGSVTTVAAAVLELPGYDRDAIHGARLPAAAVRAACDRLIGMPRSERARLPYLHPGRVDVIGAGALILRELLAATGAAELVVSEHDILDGIVASVLERSAGGGSAGTG
jgi:exopolyphosphatase/guanosine-5'-triphosphate,3'-diphosphate pyrophosphatase